MSGFLKKLFSQQVYVVTPRQAQLYKAMNEVGCRIHMGMANPLASTGTPISSLSGGARYNAVISNVGGGSKASGGGGMEGGLRMLDMQSRLSGALQESLRQTELHGKR